MTTSRATPALSLLLRNFSATEAGTWGHLMDFAMAADEAGIDRLAVSDHVVLGEDLEAYGRPGTGGTEGAKQPTGPDGHWLEPLTLLSAVAGATSRVRLHTAILLAALRRPTVLAKQLATLDVISGGRIDIGVGVGWQKEEYVACGLDYHRRGRLLDHTLEVLHTLWTDEPAAYSGHGLEFENVHCNPKPLSPNGVPLWVSGTLNDRVLERMGRFGSGWIPWGADAADPTVGVARCYEAIEAAGRSIDGFEVAGLLPTATNDDGSLNIDATMDAVPALVEAGITDFRAYLQVPEDRNEAVDFLTPLTTAFRSATS